MRPGEQTVFIVDDDGSHLRSMARLLRASGYDVQGFSSAQDLLDRLSAGATGCIISDLKMPGMDGLQLQEALNRSAISLPIIFLTGHGDVPTSVTAMRFGAEDFLLKTAPAGELLGAVERALERDARERQGLAVRRELLTRLDLLTPRENEVLGYVLRGRRNKAIAASLGISERSVKRHRTRIMKKLEVDSVAELVLLAVDAGLETDASATDD